MLIRLTAKMSKKLKIKQLPTVNDDPGPYLEWYVNVFRANRLQYIITTEAKSLLTLVMYGRGITDDDSFLRNWLGQLRDYLADIGSAFIFQRIIGPRTGEFAFAKTASRSILGSMNDMADMSKFMLKAEDLSPLELAQMINETPFKGINYQNPFRAFRELTPR